MAASSTSSIQKSFKYDVYLSFRGEDTRKNFVDHLYHALQQQGIHVFKDDVKLARGIAIGDQLVESIEDSKIFIIIFTKNYASSSWCLNELVKIMECNKMNEHTVYPVYYGVEPTEVRKQSGAVGDAFNKLKNKEDAGKWREALKEAADLAGWELNNTFDGHEAKFIKKIVEEISIELRAGSDSTNLTGVENLVGMEARIQDLEFHLELGVDDVRMIGIWGMGGAGKTTLARALFDRISIQFEGKSFVEDVGQVSKPSLSGLKLLQMHVLSDVLDDKGITIADIKEGKYMMRNLLHGKKLLIVLDGVDDIEQLEALAGTPEWFGAGSRIIITTRDKQVLLAHRVSYIHGVSLLSDAEALYLFSKYAFGRETPIQGYTDISLEVLRYADGLPIAIKVLGSFLNGKGEVEWMDALERLKQIPLKETLEKLEISYISLEEDYKEIFLDVACFMNGWDKDYAIGILESCGFHARNGLRVLEQTSLITMSNQSLSMHDQIQEMGKNIVRRSHPVEPNKHSRLWIEEEIGEILANDLGTEATYSIIVDSPVKLSSVIVTHSFRSMKNLRILHMASELDDDYDYDYEVKIDQAHQNFPNALRVLSWVGYPHYYLPETFQATNLVRLNLSYSRIVQLWEGEERKVLYNLRFLDLSFSRLTSIDLELTPNLERLDLEGCDDLVQLYTPIGCLQKLRYLNLNGCSRINTILFIKRLVSIEVLCLTRLFLEKFPDIIPENYNNRLIEFQFRYNDIEELPSSIENLQKLVYLDLHSCRKLRSLPKSICGLRHLRSLKLYGCIIEELPEDIGRLESLEKLNLSFTRIKHLPDSICMLKHLKNLNLSSCWNLEKLPEDLGQLECLQDLILSECTQVRDIPDSICMLKHLKSLNLSNCILLAKLPEGLGCLDLEVLNVKGTGIKHLPRSIYLLKDLKIYGPTLGLRSRGSASTSQTLEPSSISKQKLDDR
ncbi:disease resistance protein (TIR-NBS-LRR class) [Artemisia annua]|uniref:Disease resistance protein (TIR-NBS-LRR class) n=1 Tax=Artemisia annua TaxID=35608 RepID=A0A2U1LV13_ARTAN|nr:disease resistance protein (TIR-NBS-LRR class) [Artemisia annua]